MLQYYTCSLISHQVELKQLLCDLERKNLRVDIMLLCETFLTEYNIKLVKIPGYTLISNHRKNTNDGGVGILIRNEIPHKCRKDIDVFVEKELETVFIEINAKNGTKIIVGSMYRPPNMPEMAYIDLTCKIIGQVRMLEKKELIMGMDHNFDLLKRATHVATRSFLDTLLGNDILPTIPRLTRICKNSATLIDNIFISQS